MAERQLATVGDGTEADEFSGLVRRSMRAVRTFLDVGFDEKGNVLPDHPVEVLAKQASVGREIIQVKQRVDDGALKAHDRDRFLTVLEQIQTLPVLPVPRDDD